jgi:hypothetical protein
MKLTYQLFSTLEVIVFFAIGILGRRLLDTWLAQLGLGRIVNLFLTLAAVLLIIAAAVFVHTRLSRFLIERGWMKDSER